MKLTRHPPKVKVKIKTCNTKGQPLAKNEIHYSAWWKPKLCSLVYDLSALLACVFIWLVLYGFVLRCSLVHSHFTACIWCAFRCGQYHYISFCTTTIQLSFGFICCGILVWKKKFDSHILKLPEKKFRKLKFSQRQNLKNIFINGWRTTNDKKIFPIQIPQSIRFIL